MLPQHSFPVLFFFFFSFRSTCFWKAPHHFWDWMPKKSFHGNLYHSSGIYLRIRSFFFFVELLDFFFLSHCRMNVWVSVWWNTFSLIYTGGHISSASLASSLLSFWLLLWFVFLSFMKIKKVRLAMNYIPVSRLFFLAQHIKTNCEPTLFHFD